MNVLLLFLGLIFFQFFSYEYPKPIEGFFSQKGQDQFLYNNFFYNKRNGFFVEIGAHDGISFSNTYFFEKNFGWNGICIEPNPDIFEKLIKNRSCFCEQACISTSKEPVKYLKCTGYMLEMYSGILDYYDPRHLSRIDDEIAKYGGSKEIILLPSMPLKEIFNKYNIAYIDFLSIDIEGGEEEALKSIDFNTVTIFIIVVENNFNENNIKLFLENKGYSAITRIGKDDIYVFNEATKN